MIHSKTVMNEHFVLQDGHGWDFRTLKKYPKIIKQPHNHESFGYGFYCRFILFTGKSKHAAGLRHSRVFKLTALGFSVMYVKHLLFFLADFILGKALLLRTIYSFQSFTHFMYSLTENVPYFCSIFWRIWCNFIAVCFTVMKQCFCRTNCKILSLIIRLSFMSLIITPLIQAATLLVNSYLQ